MPDLGDRISYKVLARHTPVLSSDGEHVGTVDHVLAAEAEDVFDGVVIRRPPGHPHMHVFADADQVGEIYERGMFLKVTAAACEELPKPSANPGVIREDPGEDESHSAHKLRRAWDWISGNY